MTPRLGQEQALSEALDRLIQYIQQKPGYIAAYRLSADQHLNDKRVGRISIWESEEDANRMSSDDHDLALQAELKLLAVDDTHEEHSFTGTP
jgi:heme-degrading monooxygenase HmoA